MNRTACAQLFGICIIINVAVATEPVIIDQHGSTLVPIAEVVPINVLLADYGTSGSHEDPSLPVFLEGVLDLASEGMCQGQAVVVLYASIKSSYDEYDNLIAQELDVASYVASIETRIELISQSNGELRLLLTTYEGGQQIAFVEHAMRLYIPESPEAAPIRVIALPGECKCSKDGVTGCTQQMCEDGDTCPGNNGYSCGFYTASFSH